MRTLAARSIAGFPTMESIVEERAPLHRHVDADDVGAAAEYLLGDGARNVTGHDAVRRQRLPRDGHVGPAGRRAAGRAVALRSGSEAVAAHDRGQRGEVGGTTGEASTTAARSRK